MITGACVNSLGVFIHRTGKLRSTGFEPSIFSPKEYASCSRRGSRDSPLTRHRLLDWANVTQLDRDWHRLSCYAKTFRVCWVVVLTGAKACNTNMALFPCRRNDSLNLNSKELITCLVGVSTRLTEDLHSYTRIISGLDHLALS